MGQANADHMRFIPDICFGSLGEFVFLPRAATFTHRAQAREVFPNTLSHFTAPVIPNS